MPSTVSPEPIPIELCCDLCTKFVRLPEAMRKLGVSRSTVYRRLKKMGFKPVNKGERHHNSKLTRVDVERIRIDVTTGEPFASIARRYGVSKWAIYDIARRRTWKP